MHSGSESPSKGLGDRGVPRPLPGSSEALTVDPRALREDAERFVVPVVNGEPFTVKNWTTKFAICFFDSEESACECLASWGEDPGDWTMYDMPTPEDLLVFLDRYNDTHFYGTMEPPMSSGEPFKVFGTRNLADRLRCELIPNGPEG